MFVGYKQFIRYPNIVQPPNALSPLRYQASSRLSKTIGWSDRLSHDCFTINQPITLMYYIKDCSAHQPLVLVLPHCDSSHSLWRQEGLRVATEGRIFAVVEK